MFSNTSSVIVAIASVILAFKFVIFRTGVENNLSLTYPHKNKSRGVIYGDRGGQGEGPTLPIHLFGNVASKNRVKCEPQCGGAPSCWKIIHLTEVQRKVATCPRSFLVIKVSNQGKTLCSPCIIYLRYLLLNAMFQMNSKSTHTLKIFHVNSLLCVDKKNQLDVTFCILYFSSNSCSTCFGQPCAHHQELTTA